TATISVPSEDTRKRLHPRRRMSARQAINLVQSSLVVRKTRKSATASHCGGYGLRGTGVGGAISRVLFDRLSTVRWSSLWDGCRQPPRAAYPQLKRLGHESRCLFGLAPTGGYPATTVAGRAVGSYPTFSPLPLDKGRSVFCGPFRRLSAPRRYLAVCPMELGLSSESPDPAATRDHRAPPNTRQDSSYRPRAPPGKTAAVNSL